MRVSARADYAVRALAELAARSGESMTAESIARAQGVPLKFLLGILGELRRAGLVRSQRGPAGGYLLDRDPSSITIADVMRAVDGPLASVQDAKPEDVTYPGLPPSCRTSGSPTARVCDWCWSRSRSLICWPGNFLSPCRSSPAAKMRVSSCTDSGSSPASR